VAMAAAKAAIILIERVMANLLLCARTRVATFVR
jgi:hypothetical protein